MKEITDVDPSVLVIIVKANGDEEVAFEAFRNGSHDYLKKLGRKNILPDSNAPALPAPATVTLSQYHKIQQAVRFINDKYRSDIRLDATAREAGMSPSHFSRTFKKVMGLSYQGYLNNLRITEAKNLLHTSPRSVTEIADSLGFSDLTGFGRIFKKLTGHTPSAYRNLPRSNFLPKKA